MIECEYEFSPPGGGAPFKVLGIQSYSSGQVRKVTLWRLEPPPEHALRFGSEGPVEFDRWSNVLATLANMFCDGDQKATSDCLVVKFDQRSLV